MNCILSNNDASLNAESLTMKLGRAVAGNIIYRALNMITGLIITLLFTRLMGSAGYGLLSLLVANVTLFSLVTCLGSESGITYHYASGSIQRNRIFSIVYQVILFQLLLLVITEFVYKQITGHYWLLGGNKLIYLLWGILYLFSVTVSDKYNAYLNASHRYVQASSVIFWSNIITIAVIGAIYISGTTHDVFFYLQLFIASAFLQSILLMIIFHVSTRQKPAFAKSPAADWRKFFSYSFIVFVTNVIQFFAYRVDFWLVDYYKGESELGYYSLATKLGQFFWVIPLLLASMIFPLFADKKTEFNESRLVVLVRVTNLLSLAAMLVSALLIGWILPLAFGKEFASSVEPFLYMLPGLFLFSINIMLAAYFAGVNRLKINLTGSVICFVLVLAADLWLIPSQGIMGAAIATSIAYAASGMYSMMMFAALTGLGPVNFFIFRKSDWTAWYQKITRR